MERLLSFDAGVELGVKKRAARNSTFVSSITGASIVCEISNLGTRSFSPASNS